MPRAIKICESVFQIGGGMLSSGEDCAIYLVEIGEKMFVLIDSGTGKSFSSLANNIRTLGFELKKLSALILTHCHIDHIGGAAMFNRETGCKIIAHEQDADAIEQPDSPRTAAGWYGVKYTPVKVDMKISSSEMRTKLGNVEFVFVHTPGHTPGSMAVYIDIEGKRVLFGQDIHGPFDESFGSDIELWRESMRKLLALNADILCEGHFGIFRPAERVRAYIEGYLKQYRDV